MIKQTSSSSEKKHTMTTEIETLEPELMKKLQISTPTETKECVKAGGKGNLRQKQENIMQEIENANIQ